MRCPVRCSERGARRGFLWRQVSFTRVDQLEMQFAVLAHEAGHEEEVFHLDAGDRVRFVRLRSAGPQGRRCPRRGILANYPVLPEAAAPPTVAEVIKAG